MFMVCAEAVVEKSDRGKCVSFSYKSRLCATEVRKGMLKNFLDKETGGVSYEL